ncbi:MAG: hypothetical protein NDI61_01760 [Bdellovibrionaceae bacterium]|nr:hypothetical protein [Pseudobdellovibrionaceae bacterium]
MHRVLEGRIKTDEPVHEKSIYFLQAMNQIGFARLQSVDSRAGAQVRE